MEKEQLDALNKLPVGKKFNAIIRHFNKKLELPDETVILKKAEDGFYIDDGPDELSYNWDIVEWAEI